MEKAAKLMYCDCGDCRRFFTTRCDLPKKEGATMETADGHALQDHEIVGFVCNCCKNDVCHECFNGIELLARNKGGVASAKFEPLCPDCASALTNFISDGHLEEILYLFLQKRHDKVIESDADFVTLLRQDLD